MECSDRAKSNSRRLAIEYLRGFGFTDVAQIDALIPRLLDRTTRRMSDPASTVAAMDRRVADWFRSVLAMDDAAPDRILRLGRAAFLLSDAASRWPDAFLRSQEPAAALVPALRRAAPVATPPEQPSAMIAQPLPLPSLGRLVLRPRRRAAAGSSDSAP